MQRKIMGTPIVLTVGGEYDGEGEPILAIERADIRRKILTKAAEVFRGVTLTDTDGAWIDANGVVVIERGFQVLVYPNPASRVSMTEFVEFVLSVSRQTSIMSYDHEELTAYEVSNGPSEEPDPADG